MIRYKVNVLALLKEAGYSSYKIRKEKLFGEAHLHAMRNMELPSWAILNRICKLTGKDVSELIEYVED